jgi:competence protein ComEC
MRDSAQYQKLYRQPIVMTAQVDNDAIYGRQSQLSFDVVQAAVIRPKHRSLVGKIKVEGMGVPMIYRGDLVQVEGSMMPTKGSAQAKFSFAKLTLIKRGGSPIDTIRRKFIAGLGTTLPEPEASFGAGLLLGQRSTIPKDISDQLSATGLTHLVAVSGYNLTIIIVAARKLLGKASKFQSTVCAAALMVLFTLVTGFSASIVRAALVSGLSLLAWYYGRRFKPALLIAGTAAAMALWNPFYLWSDIGWYLSFLAFFGVLLLAPLLGSLIGRGKPLKLVGALLAETIAAQIMTLPIIMYIFGRVSLVGLLANILVVPLVPLAMLLTLVAGLAGMIYAPVGGWLAWPAKELLTYMVDLVGLLSRLPHAQAQKLISLRAMLAGYGLILFACLCIRRFLTSRNWLDYDKITE